MKRLFITCLSLTLGCVCAMAQINLREGIVITLQGDTLHGDIDYRTDVYNTEQCVFIADQGKESKTYKPGEISGYRFIDNGRYYVSRVIDEDKRTGEKKYAFLEWIVKGTLSYYYMSTVSADFYFLEDEQGKMIKFSDVEELAQPVERRQKLQEAFGMIYRSEQAKKLLWGTQVNKNNIKKVTLRYNKDVCPDGNCEVFEYRGKRAAKTDKYAHWTLKAGYSPILFRIGGHESAPSKLCPAFRVSAGVNVFVARVMPNLFYQVYAEYCQTFNADVESLVYQEGYAYTYRPVDYLYKEGSLKLGIGYEIPMSSKLKCRIFGGKDINYFSHKYNKQAFTDYTITTNMSYEKGIFVPQKSYYYGANLAYPMGKHCLLLEADFYWKKRCMEDWPTRRPSIMIGYQF